MGKKINNMTLPLNLVKSTPPVSGFKDTLQTVLKVNLSSLTALAQGL